MVLKIIELTKFVLNIIKAAFFPPQRQFCQNVLEAAALRGQDAEDPRPKQPGPHIHPHIQGSRHHQTQKCNRTLSW